MTSNFLKLFPEPFLNQTQDRYDWERRKEGYLAAYKGILSKLKQNNWLGDGKTELIQDIQREIEAVEKE